MGLLNAFGAMGRILVTATLVCVASAILASGGAQVALFVVALSLGVTGLVLVGVSWRLGRIAGLDRAPRVTTRFATPEATRAVLVEPNTNDIRDTDDVLSTQRCGTAVITSMEDAGDMFELGLAEVGISGNDDPLFIIGLEVQQAGTASYEVRVADRVPECLLGRVGPRTHVDVAIDKFDDDAVSIDWSSVRR